MKSKGFTLIELLVTIVAIAFLGGLVYVVAHFIHKFW